MKLCTKWIQQLRSLFVFNTVYLFIYFSQLRQPYLWFQCRRHTYLLQIRWFRIYLLGCVFLFKLYEWRWFILYFSSQKQEKIEEKDEQLAKVACGLRKQISKSWIIKETFWKVWLLCQIYSNPQQLMILLFPWVTMMLTIIATNYIKDGTQIIVDRYLYGRLCFILPSRKVFLHLFFFSKEQSTILGDKKSHIQKVKQFGWPNFNSWCTFELVVRKWAHQNSLLKKMIKVSKELKWLYNNKPK